jgi:hypothetical protein
VNEVVVGSDTGTSGTCSILVFDIDIQKKLASNSTV